MSVKFEVSERDQLRLVGKIFLQSDINKSNGSPLDVGAGESESFDMPEMPWFYVFDANNNDGSDVAAFTLILKDEQTHGVLKSKDYPGSPDDYGLIFRYP